MCVGPGTCMLQGIVWYSIPPFINYTCTCWTSQFWFTLFVLQATTKQYMCACIAPVATTSTLTMFYSEYLYLSVVLSGCNQMCTDTNYYLLHVKCCLYPHHYRHKEYMCTCRYTHPVEQRFMPKISNPVK